MIEKRSVPFDYNEMQKKLLLDGEIDLAIGSFAASEPGIDLYDFYNEETVLLVQKEQMEKCYYQELGAPASYPAS